MTLNDLKSGISGGFIHVVIHRLVMSAMFCLLEHGSFTQFEIEAVNEAREAEHGLANFNYPAFLRLFLQF